MMVITKREGLLIDAGVDIGQFESKLAAMDAAEAHLQALDKASGTDSFGRALNEAEEIAVLVLAGRGLPTDFPKGQPTATAIGNHVLKDWWGTFTDDQNARLTADQSLEATAAVSLKIRCFELRQELARSAPEERDMFFLLVQLGRDMERLIQQKLHGSRIDAKRRSDEAIASRAHSEADKRLILDTFSNVRPSCSCDAEGYRKVIELLGKMDLTESAVRHVIKPRVRKPRQ